MKEIKEEWKDIPEYEGEYQLSNYGRQKSLKRRYVKEDIILKPKIDAFGHPTLYLQANYYKKTFRIKNMVAKMFLGIDVSDKSHIVRHKDGDITNCHANNLISVKRTSKTVPPNVGKIDFNRISHWVIPGIVNRPINKVIFECCNHFNISTKEFYSKRRFRDVVQAKKMASYILHKIKKITSQESAALIGIDHSTVLFHCKDVEGLMSVSKKYDAQVKELIEKVV
jgi:hypothetical protein